MSETEKGEETTSIRDGRERDLFRDRVDSICAEERSVCEHAWEVAGSERVSAAVINMFEVCRKCSSFTYTEMFFVGFRKQSLEDHVAEKCAEDDSDDSEEAAHLESSVGASGFSGQDLGDYDLDEDTSPGDRRE